MDKVNPLYMIRRIIKEQIHDLAPRVRIDEYLKGMRDGLQYLCHDVDSLIEDPRGESNGPQRKETYATQASRDGHRKDAPKRPVSVNQHESGEQQASLPEGYTGGFII